jgi:hypothetical protein
MQAQIPLRLFVRGAELAFIPIEAQSNRERRQFAIPLEQCVGRGRIFEQGGQDE